MQVTIEIDLGPFADGFEPVGFRPPKKGENYIASNGHVNLACVDFREDELKLIVRRKRQAMTLDELKHAAEVGSFWEVRKALLAAIQSIEDLQQQVDYLQLRDERRSRTK